MTARREHARAARRMSVSGQWTGGERYRSGLLGGRGRGATAGSAGAEWYALMAQFGRAEPDPNGRNVLQCFVHAVLRPVSRACLNSNVA